MNKLNLIGQKYHRLTVLEGADPIGGRSAWACQCDCGTIKTIKTEELRSGGTKSCGCWNDEQRSARAENMYSKCIKYTPDITSARRVWKHNGYNDYLSFEQFYELSQQNCHYCHTPPSNITNQAKTDKNASMHAKINGDFIYNGLDRIDSSKKHTLENCVPCCKHCNYAKRDRTTQEFYDWIARVYQNIPKT